MRNPSAIVAQSRLGIGNRRLLALLGLCSFNLLSLAALLCFARAINAGPPSPRDLYVSANGTGQACTFAQPCALATALSQANDGDAIRLAAGVYTGAGEAVVILEKSVRLIGGWPSSLAAYAGHSAGDHAILDGERARRVVIVRNNAAPQIAGLHITRGAGLVGAGIYVAWGSPLIVGNRINDNHAENAGGGIMAGGETIIAKNEIISNSATFGGGGIHVYSDSAVTLDGNIIADNASSYGAVLHVDGAVVRASGNVTLRNRGGSAWSLSAPNTRALRSSLDNNVIAEGETDTAVQIINHRADLLHNTIARCRGIAVDIFSDSAVTMTNNILAFAGGQGIRSSADSHLTMNHNLFWRNGRDPIVGVRPVLSDPRFRSMEAGDYRPGPGSPAIDAGAATTIDRDIQGNVRPIGAAVDIGAYEVSWPQLHLPLALRTR